MAVAQAAEKPVILYFNTAPSDKALTEISNKRQQKLRGCGFDVKASTEFGSKAWSEFIIANKTARPSHIFLEGHGINLAEIGGVRLADSDQNAGRQKLFLTSSEDGFAVDIGARDGAVGAKSYARNAIELKDGELSSRLNEWERVALLNRGSVEDSEKLISKLDESFSSAQLWIDTCFSGACQVCRNIGVGTSCSTQQKSYDFSKLTDDIIDLICDSGPNGNCELFRSVDENGDGEISPAELRKHWETKYPASPQAVSGAQSTIRTHLSAAEVASSLGIQPEALKLGRTFPASARIRYGVGKALFDPVLNAKIGTDRDGEPDPEDIEKYTGITFARPLTEAGFSEWKRKVVQWAEERSDLMLARARFDFIPPTFEYEPLGVKPLQPFEQAYKDKLSQSESGRKAALQTVTPHLGNFTLKGKRCSVAEAHEKTSVPSKRHSED